MKNIIYAPYRILLNMKYHSFLIGLILVLISVAPAKAAVINCYPMLSDAYNWTGSCNSSGTKTQTSLMHAVGANGERAWAKFDISTIPPGSIINSVTLKFWVSSCSTPYYQIRRVTSDPVTASGSTLYTLIGSGTLYASNNGATANMYNSKNLSNGAPAALQASLPSGWFAIGIYETDYSSYWWLWADGWNQAHPPYLEVNYTTTFQNDIGIDSISKPTNPSCEGTLPVKVKLFNGGVNTIISTTIQWMINGVTQTSFPWSGSLAPGASVTVTLGNITFVPGNTTIYAQATLPNGQGDPFPTNNFKTVIIQIIPKPTVLIQPVDQSIALGGNAVFSLVASGGNLTYQWQVSLNGGSTFIDLFNVDPYSNVTTNNLIITNATQNMNGYLFRCLVTGTCPPSAISDTVLLSVGPPIRATAGTGHACAGQTTSVPITAINLTDVYTIKLSMNFTPINVAYAGYSNLNPLLSTGSFSITQGAGLITLLWSSTTPVTVGNIKICDLNFTYTNNSPLSFDSVTAGNSQFVGSGGVIYPSHYTNGNISTAIPTIIAHPDDQLAIVGYPSFFRVLYSGAPVFQWQVKTSTTGSWTNIINNTTYSGAQDDTLWVNAPTLSMNNYRYQCILSACSTSVTTNSALMTVIKLVKTWIDTLYSCPCVTPYPEVLVPIRVQDFDSISSVSLHLLFKKTALEYMGYTYVNPHIPNPVIYNSMINPTYGDIGIAAYDAIDTFLIPDEQPMIIFKFKVKCDTTKLIWNTWDPGACQYSSGLTVFTANFSNGFVLNGGPFVTSQPANQTVYTGDMATFSCTGATYTAPLTYQWQYRVNAAGPWIDLVNNPPNITGATTGTLSVLASLVTMNGYQYRCKIMGLCPEVFTDTVTLTVNSPPIYVTPPLVYSCQGDTIYVPINVTNFSQVCSFSMKLKFSGSQMQYFGYGSVNPNLSAAMLTINASVDTVIMFYSSLVPATIAGTGTLFQLKFVTSNLFAGSPLTWKTTPAGFCQITNCAAGNITTVWNNTTVTVSALPQAHNMTTLYPGGGHFCAGENGAPIGVDITQAGINYILYRDNTAITGPIPGTGFGYTFGTYNVPGHYTVKAVNPTTQCYRWMDGFIDVVADPPPQVFSITPSANQSYCSGGQGINVQLSGSQANVDYFLTLNGSTIDTIQGTGAALSFGYQTAAGTYAISARNTLTETCPTSMTGTLILVVNPYPAPAGTITGESPVCQGQTKTYTVPVIADATSYVWTYPNGANGSTTTTTNSTTVTFTNTATTGLITVKGQNGCGFGTSSNITVTVNPLPAAAGAISGPATVCQGSPSVTYSVPGSQYATGYAWTAPPGFNIVSNSGNSITYSVSTSAVGGNITVKGTNSCGDGPVSTLAITISPLPGNAASISGSTNPCQGLPQVYTTAVIANASSYIWTFPPGATGTSPTATPMVTVNYSTSASNGSITVTGSNGCGTGSTFTLPIFIQHLPLAAQSITGPVQVCKNTNGVQYTCTPAIEYATNYVWTYPGTGVTASPPTNLQTLILNFASNAVSGNITVRGQNNCGQGTLFTLPVTVNNLPTVTLANFADVCIEGGPVTLTGGSPANGTYSGPGITNGVFNPMVPGIGNWNITYTYTDGNNCTSSASKSINVINKPRITGTIKYDNVAQTTMGNVKVYLKNSSNVTIDSTLSLVGLGDYWFYCRNNGTYNMSATTTRLFVTGTVNSLDALAIAKHSVGMINLSAFRQKAADVNNSNSINAGDALMVMRRFVGQITEFYISDWLFDITNPFSVNNADYVMPIKALLAGDVDGSHTPSTAKTEPSVFINTRGMIRSAQYETVEIPVSFQGNTTISAISLALHYPPEALEVIGVKSKMNDLIYNILDDEVRVAWYSLEPRRFNQGEAIITLTVRVKPQLLPIESILLEADAISVIADQDGNAMEQVMLTMPQIKVGFGPDDQPLQSLGAYSLEANHPNPFNELTEIDYTLPETGEVTLTILNLLGEKMEVVVHQKQAKGQYHLTFDGRSYTPGMYLYKLEVNGETRHFLQTKTMIIKD